MYRIVKNFHILSYRDSMCHIGFIFPSSHSNTSDCSYDPLRMLLK